MDSRLSASPPGIMSPDKGAAAYPSHQATSEKSSPECTSIDSQRDFAISYPPRSRPISRFTITPVAEPARRPQSLLVVGAQATVPSNWTMPGPMHSPVKADESDGGAIKRIPSAPDLPWDFPRPHSFNERTGMGLDHSSLYQAADESGASSLMAYTQDAQRKSSSGSTSSRQNCGIKPMKQHAPLAGSSRGSTGDAILAALHEMSARQKQHGDLLASLIMLTRRQQEELLRLHVLQARQSSIIENMAVQSHFRTDGHSSSEEATNDMSSALAILDMENEGLRSEIDMLTAELASVRLQTTPTGSKMPLRSPAA